jgi:hypothetical protein
MDAWVYLSTAKDDGDIGGYRELGGGKWLIQVPANAIRRVQRSRAAIQALRPVRAHPAHGRGKLPL